MDEIFVMVASACAGGIMVTGTACAMWLMLAWTQSKANSLIKEKH